MDDRRAFLKDLYIGKYTVDLAERPKDAEAMASYRKLNVKESVSVNIFMIIVLKISQFVFLCEPRKETQLIVIKTLIRFRQVYKHKKY